MEIEVCSSEDCGESAAAGQICLMSCSHSLLFICCSPQKEEKVWLESKIMQPDVNISLNVLT